MSATRLTDLADDSGQDGIPDVVPKLGLECEVALGVEEQVLGESLNVVAESLVERVVGQSGEPQLDLVKQSFLVTLVFVGEEFLSRLLELFAFTSALVVEDPAWLEEGSVSIVVGLGEPVSKALVVLCISVDLIERIGNTVHRFAVGESLEDFSELRSRGADT